MKILILNWRDIKNPAGGGAEILTYELAKGFVNSGNDVTWLTANYKDGKTAEEIDNIKIIRKGRWWNVHIFAFFYYLKNSKDIDVIIDEIHWFPFFSAIYAKRKTIALTCEVADKLFYTLFPYPIALALRGIEKIYLSIYSCVPTFTISESTKKDLIKEGVNKNSITVLRLGINIPKKLKDSKKEKNPTFIYLARLNKQKGIFDAISAFRIINKNLKYSLLWVVGSGEQEVIEKVKEKITTYNLKSSVKFFGFVNEEKKYDLLAKAHILIAPSVQEGWGLTVIEAGSVGTPSVGYNVGGLIDSIVNNKTGILTNPNPESLAKGALQLFNNKVQYKRFSKNTKTWSRNFNWDLARKKSLELIQKFYKSKHK